MKEKKSWRLDDETKRRIRIARVRGATYAAIAKMYKLSTTTVVYLCDPERRKAVQATYYAKNRDKIIAGMRAYAKRKRAV